MRFQGASLQNKLRNLLKSCKYFFLCLDESVDIQHISQLNIFTRILLVQDDFSYIEKLLDFVSFHNITRNFDIFLIVKESLKKFDIDRFYILDRLDLNVFQL